MSEATARVGLEAAWGDVYRHWYIRRERAREALVAAEAACLGFGVLPQHLVELVTSEALASMARDALWARDRAARRVKRADEALSLMEAALSRAVVANSPHGGVLLWRQGSHIDHAMEAWAGALYDIGLDDAPLGISVWEGCYTFRESRGMEGDYDVDVEAHGAFREPTDTEWDAIRRGVSPWAEALGLTGEG